MKQRISILAALVGAITVIACGLHKSAPPAPAEPPATVQSASAAASKAAPPPSTDSTDDSVGTVFTTMRGTNGSQRVSCDAIATEFKLEPNGGRIRWTAQALDRYTDKPWEPGSVASGVTVTPSSGVLDPGASQVIRISGSFTGPDRKFWVAVSAPNRTGHSGSTIEFSC
jgi:hypothetical protein